MRVKRSPAPRRGARTSRRFLWVGAAAAIIVAGAALIAADGAPPSRHIGAGLVPEEVPRLAPAPPPAMEPGAASRRAEIAAEEARLAALREARMQLEREIETLRQEAEQRRRDMPGRKSAGENLAAATVPGVTAPAVATAAPAVQPAAAATPEPPAGRGLRIFVHHRANSPQSAGAAEEVTQNLRAAGFEIAAVRAAPFVPSTPVVRYFHDEDQAAAARLAGRLGRGWAIQDFRAYEPQPAPQTLEVWLPGN